MENDKKTYKVTLQPDGTQVEISPGESLLEAATKAGIILNAECGGAGLCGRCKIKLISGKITSKETFLLSEKERKSGYLLACTSFPTGDVVVESPQASFFSRDEVFSSTYETHHAIQNPYKHDPLIEKIFIHCPFPNECDSMSDFDRLSTVLKRKIGIGEFRLSAGLLKKLPELLRNSSWKITITYTRAVSPCEILDIEEGDKTRLNFGIVIDLGTTSIEASAVDLVTGKTLHFCSYLNPQVKYGENVTDRLKFASQKNGLLILNDIIIDKINEIINELIFESGANKEHFKSVMICCNTIMLHFLLGIGTNHIYKPPNIPVVLQPPVFKAQDIHLFPEEALVFFSPCLGSYVGGDVIASLIATGMKEKNYLLVDIGTNGEVAAMTDGACTCAATSAGPAFEGGGVKWGKRASNGAINRFYFNKKKKDFALMTIGNKRPNGICGVGMIDFLSTLMLTGYIDKKGAFNNRAGTSRFRVIDGEKHFVVKTAKNIKDSISITENEVKYLINSKGAIYSGLEFLMTQADSQFEELDKFYISGALGGSIDIESGINIGLFPDIEREKFIFIGNGSLKGGLFMLLSQTAWKKALDTVRGAAYFDLSTEPLYMNSYTSSLFLPHTDLKKFPNVVKKLPENIKLGFFSDNMNFRKESY